MITGQEMGSSLIRINQMGFERMTQAEDRNKLNFHQSDIEEYNNSDRLGEHGFLSEFVDSIKHLYVKEDGKMYKTIYLRQEFSKKAAKARA